SLCLLAAVMLQWNTKAVAIPDLQLFIPGSTYNLSTETWDFTHTPGSPFTLQVISANENHPRDGSTGVFVSVALLGIGEFDPLPSGPIMSFDGVDLFASDFTWGAPAPPPPHDLPSHGIFDTHFAEVNVGTFGTSETVFNTIEDEGDDDSKGFPGEVRDFLVTINSPIPVHFDAYTQLNSIHEFAPPSHDAQANPVPEPATIALLSLGIVGLFGYKGRRFLRKS
ncbi:MAG: choice-of-anchor N protein, partial [Candidatus Brocadiales bacterium]